MKNFFDCVIFDGESFVYANFSLLQFRVRFCTCVQWKKCVFECKSCENVVFGIFECFSRYELERSMYQPQNLQNEWKQINTFGVLLHNVMPTKKAVGVSFETLFFGKTRFLTKLAKNHHEMLLESAR